MKNIDLHVPDFSISLSLIIKLIYVLQKSQLGYCPDDWMDKPSSKLVCAPVRILPMAWASSRWTKIPERQNNALVLSVTVMFDSNINTISFCLEKKTQSQTILPVLQPTLYNKHINNTYNNYINLEAMLSPILLCKKTLVFYLGCRLIYLKNLFTSHAVCKLDRCLEPEHCVHQAKETIITHNHPALDDKQGSCTHLEIAIAAPQWPAFEGSLMLPHAGISHW